MPADIRAAMVDAAWLMLGESGVEGLSVLEVLRRTGAPRGSVQHYFPGGREQLVAEAIDRSRRWMAEQILAIEADTAADVVTGFLGVWRRVLAASDFQAGCAAAGLITGTYSEAHSRQAGLAFDESVAALAERFAGVGIAAGDAAERATLLVSAAEGAVLLARGKRSDEPLNAVEGQLRDAWA